MARMLSLFTSPLTQARPTWWVPMRGLFSKGLVIAASMLASKFGALPLALKLPLPLMLLRGLLLKLLRQAGKGSSAESTLPSATLVAVTGKMDQVPSYTRKKPGSRSLKCTWDQCVCVCVCMCQRLFCADRTEFLCLGITYFVYESVKV
jgi:hypothetical protein